MCCNKLKLIILNSSFDILNSWLSRLKRNSTLCCRFLSVLILAFSFSCKSPYLKIYFSYPLSTWISLPLLLLSKWMTWHHIELMRIYEIPTTITCPHTSINLVKSLKHRVHNITRMEMSEKNLSLPLSVGFFLVVSLSPVRSLLF